MGDLVMKVGGNVVVAIVLLFVLLVVGIYDAIAIMFFGEGYTISMVVKSWARHFPILAVLVGIVVGHLFWPVEPSHTPTPTETLHNGIANPEAERMDVTP